MDDVFLPHHRDLIHELQRAGFTEENSHSWRGSVGDDSHSWAVEITFDAAYPVRPPKVLPLDEGGALGWHQNPDRSMCLYGDSQPVWAPWFAEGDLLSRIAAWCRQKERGWPDDQPDLDLQRYWHRSPQYDLAIHNPLPTGCRGTRSFELIPQTRTLREVNLSGRPAGSSGAKHPRAFLADLGELDTPITSRDQLFARMPDSQHAAARIEKGRNPLLLLRYSRRGHVGSLMLNSVGQATDFELAAIETAEDSPAVLDLRRGAHVQELAAKKVAIVGAGAVGSFIAGCLFRAGVTQLTLIDHELLRPGNLARHAADARWVGFSKSEAMVRTLGGAPARGLPVRMNSLSEARQLVRDNDLVVDATADEGVTTLLTLAAEDRGRTVIAAYLANQGRSRVVEVLRSPSSERSSTTQMTPIGVDGFEAGCGDPVSPTPLYAVQETAAMACRTAISVLLGEGEPRSEVRENP